MKRTALALTFILALLVSTMVGVTTVHFGKAQAFTNVGGIISTNAIWTKANSPYNLTDNVIVKNGITLTIEPGVTVYSYDHFLQVNGTLVARGTNLDKIFFMFLTFQSNLFMSGLNDWTPLINFVPGSASWNESSNSGSIIENVNITSVRANDIISINYVSPKISNNTIQQYIEQTGPFGIVWQDTCPISIVGGSPIISNNYLESDTHEIDITNSTATILNNTITGVGIDQGGTVQQSGGIRIYGGSPTIEGNFLFHNSGGVTLMGGIYVDGITTALITNNSIIQNSPGIRIDAHSWSATVKFNNILDNGFGPTPGAYGGNVAFYTSDSSFNNSVIDATNNYWGTSDLSAINQSIRDIKTDPKNGIVNFVPFLTQPNPEAPKVIFTISVSNTEGGTINYPNQSTWVPVISPQNFSLVYGDNQQFFIEANNGTDNHYIVNAIFLDGLPINLTGLISYQIFGYYSFNGVTANHTIFVDFEPNPTVFPTPTPTPTPTFTITMTHVGSGTTSPLDGQHIVSSPVTLTATPENNFAFMYWLKNGLFLSDSNPFLYSPTNNDTITAIFNPATTSSPSPSPTSTPTPTPTSTSTPTASQSPSTAPLSTPTSTPTVPEFPTLIILPLFAVVILLSIGFARNRIRKK